MMLGPLQTKWIEALESGQFEQGTGWLRCGNLYCCLGVLTEHVLRIEPEVGCEDAYWYGGESSSVNEHYRSRVGLSRQGESLLLSMNDDQGLSFSEIARAIKADPGKFFTEAK